MSQAVAIFFGLLLLSTVVLVAGWALAYRLMAGPGQRSAWRRLLSWSAKGWLLPVVLWGLMNVGLSFELQPFMPAIQAARNNGEDWVGEFLAALGMGLFVISSYWTAGTLLWGLVLIWPQADRESRKDFKALCWTCGLGFLLPALLVVGFGGWPTVGLAVTLMLGPMAAYAPGLLRPKPMPPMYARAIARMKFGKYSEAEWEILKELEKREDDFEGWMMLAELYANHFDNLAEAEQTVLEICSQPKTTPTQLSIALHRLADWQLKKAGNPEAARQALQLICDRVPGTHLARMAQLRQAQLPANAAELKEQQIPQPLPLPALGDTLDQAPTPEPDRAKSTAQANACVAKLRQDPDNVVAREKLARLLAEHLGQAEQGLEQVQLLLGMPDQPAQKRAEWLGLLAAWQLRYRENPESGRQTLQRLVAEFPQSPQALAARHRLRLLDEAAHPPAAPPVIRIQPPPLRIVAPGSET